MAGQLTDHSVWINLTHKPLNHQKLSSVIAKSGCVLFCSRLFFALSVLALAQSAHSVALHAGILLSHDSPHPLMHSAVWGIHRFPGWLFLELICVYVRMCVLAICMSMSLTQSICYTSSGTNLSNISYDCVVPQNLEWFMCMCVCMLWATSHHIALLWQCTKANVSAHLILCACVFSQLQEADQMPNYM